MLAWILVTLLQLKPQIMQFWGTLQRLKFVLEKPKGTILMSALFYLLESTETISYVLSLNRLVSWLFNQLIICTVHICTVVNWYYQSCKLILLCSYYLSFFLNITNNISFRLKKTKNNMNRCNIECMFTLFIFHSEYKMFVYLKREKKIMQKYF